MTAWALLDAGRAPVLPESVVGRVQFEIGRLVDESSLFYEAWRIGRADRGRLRARVERYRCVVDFLEKTRAFYDPTRLFPPPERVPVVERRPMHLYGLPPFESVRFPSAPAEIFPKEMGTLPRDPTGRNVHARAYVWRHGDRDRRTVLCVHGYRGGFVALDGRAFDVPGLFAAGLDVALAVLPYHGPRTPQGSLPGARFLDDPRRTLEAALQAVADLRALASWLRAEGASAVGVAGVSLGGYLAALLASVDGDLDFVASIIPVASFADLMWERAGRRGEHELAAEEGLDLDLLRRLFSLHCPLVHRPLVAAGRRLVIGGEADRIAPPSHAAALAAHWETTVHWFRGGHLAQFGRGAALARLRSLAAGA